MSVIHTNLLSCSPSHAANGLAASWAKVSGFRKKKSRSPKHGRQVESSRSSNEEHEGVACIEALGMEERKARSDEKANIGWETLQAAEMWRVRARACVSMCIWVRVSPECRPNNFRLITHAPPCCATAEQTNQMRTSRD